MSEVNERLASLWRELLTCADASADADFFDLGGTSIAAVYLAAMIQETFGVAVDAIEVVTLRTFGQLSKAVSARLDAEEPV
ncbi:phosphopantetheine-binding protein [Streptomyces sp. NPDC002677]|uniref:phosphopantetheine-binding protein n=1 Tax=Streptomyces sp. NPDC002677 TaxID=3154774 RepID=UPI00332F0D8B